MFTKITSGQIVNDVGNSASCAWADYDNDGFLDLLLARDVGIDWLFHNDGNGVFRSITNNLIGSATEGSYAAAWVNGPGGVVTHRHADHHQSQRYGPNH